MRKMVLSLLLMVLVGSLASCASVLNAPMYQTGTISHVVVCYLKNHGNAADRKKIVDATRELRGIRGVYDISVGYVLPSDRPVVVGDYDVALVATFRDEAAMHAYEKDPLHQKAVKEVLEPLTSKIVIYDFVNQE
jgi:hypothetical protein